MLTTLLFLLQPVAGVLSFVREPRLIDTSEIFVVQKIVRTFIHLETQDEGGGFGTL